MANVNPLNGMMYGFRLMGYLITVLGVGVVLSLIGFSLVDGGSLISGGVVFLIGILAVFAGQAGVLYKVIADGFEKGMSAANS
ncbi:MAG: hypothetical protein J07HX5_01367 [halophilic archaeon J07HX5]|jgi:hypothetical protein|nr:MAG: hypothetical protein J07HX5_01367 [halophilic archaeon J07HX5]